MGKLNDYLREKRGENPTQQEMADALEISLRQYQRYEKDAYIHPNKLIKISEILKFDFYEALNLSGPHSTTEMDKPPASNKPLNGKATTVQKEINLNQLVEIVQSIDRKLSAVETNLENNIDLTLINNSLSQAALFRLAEQDARELKKDPKEIFQVSVKTAEKLFDAITPIYGRDQKKGKLSKFGSVVKVK